MRPKGERDSDDAWFAYPGERRSIEVYATEPAYHPIGFDLRSKKERNREQKKMAKDKGGKGTKKGGKGGRGC